MHILEVPSAMPHKTEVIRSLEVLQHANKRAL